MLACVCVYVCIHVQIYGYRWCGRSKKCECAYVFTCVFHRLVIDGWILACVCVYVCIHVHIGMYRSCGRVEG
jgi:hypothetical protein